MPAYIPKQGDIIAINFDPQSGHEQNGRRPAFVVSKNLFNRSTGLAIVCPITNTKHDFPFHVPIPKGGDLTGFIMVEQVKSMISELAVQNGLNTLARNCLQRCFQYLMRASTKRVIDVLAFFTVRLGLLMSWHLAVKA